MSHRIEQINELLKSEIAHLLSTQIGFIDCLPTITYVKCTPDIKKAVIGLSILPANHSGTALKRIRKHNKLIIDTLRKKLDLKFIPRITWEIDEGEKHRNKIEKILEKIKQEDG